MLLLLVMLTTLLELVRVAVARLVMVLLVLWLLVRSVICHGEDRLGVVERGGVCEVVCRGCVAAAPSRVEGLRLVLVHHVLRRVEVPRVLTVHTLIINLNQLNSNLDLSGVLGFWGFGV